MQKNDRANLRKLKQDFFTATIYNEITQGEQIKEGQG